MSLPVNPIGAPPPGTFPSGFPVDGLPTAKDLKDLPPLFHNTSLKFSPPAGKVPAGDKGAPTDAPDLDGVDEDLDGILAADMMLSVLGDLEKILAEAMTESNEKQVKLAKERIEVLKDQIAKTKEERLKKVDESMKAMDKAAKASIFTKVFGWLMTALTVVFAIAASFVTGGAAIGPIVAAATAVAFQVLGETGVTDKLVEKLTDALKKAGMSKMAAQIVSQVFVAVVQIGLTIGAGALGKMAEDSIKVGVKTLAEVAKTFARKILEDIAKNLMVICKAALAGGGLVMLGMGGYNAIRQYKSGNEQAELKELESFLARLQQGLDETDEELQKLVEQMQTLVSDILKLVTNPIETAGEISNNFV